MTGTGGRGLRWGWLVLGVVAVGVAALLAATGWSGACTDYAAPADGLSTCGPTSADRAGRWVLVVVAATIGALALRRGLRRSNR